MTENQAYVILVWGYEQDRINDQITAAKILAKTIKKQDQRPVWLLFASEQDSNETFDSNIDRVVTQLPGPSQTWAISTFATQYDNYEFIFLSATSLILFDISHVWHSFRHDDWVIPMRVKDHRNNSLALTRHFKEQKIFKEENLVPCQGLPCFIRTTPEVRDILHNISIMDEVWPDVKRSLYHEESKLNKSWNYFTSFVLSTGDVIRQDPSLDLIYMARRDALDDEFNWSKRSWIEFLNYYLVPGNSPCIKIENYIQLGLVDYADLNLVEKLKTWAEKS